MVKMMPGMGKISNKQLDDAERKNKQYEGMIMSMTKGERTVPDLLATNPTRRTRYQGLNIRQFTEGHAGEGSGYKKGPRF